MNKSTIFKITLFIGFLPFIIALLTGVYTMFVERSSFTFAEYMFLYSFIHWPGYISGIVLIIFSLFNLKKHK